MSTVEVVINNKSYKIGCSTDDVELTKSYATLLDNRIKEMKLENPTLFIGISQEIVFLSQAFLLMTELDEKKDNARKVQHEVIDKSDIDKLQKKIFNLQETIIALETIIKNQIPLTIETEDS